MEVFAELLKAIQTIIESFERAERARRPLCRAVGRFEGLFMIDAGLPFPDFVAALRFVGG